MVSILELFVREPLSHKSLADVVRTLGLNKATALSILTTLVDLGWLSRDHSTKTYRMGPGLLALGRATETGFAGSDVVSSEIAGLAALHNLTMSVAALVYDEIRVVDVAGPPGDDRAEIVRSGLNLPFVPPLGAVFAAWASAERTRAWLDRAPTHRRGQHEEALQSLRKAGFAIAPLDDASRTIRQAIAGLAGVMGGREPQQALVGLLSELSTTTIVDHLSDARNRYAVDVVGVPVLDQRDHTVLALSAQVGSVIPRARLVRLVSDLRDAAGRISASLR